jgi:hypothetical protein
MDDATRTLLWERFLPFVNTAWHRATEGSEGDIPHGIAEDVFSDLLYDHPGRRDFSDTELLRYAPVGLSRYVTEEG